MNSHERRVTNRYWPHAAWVSLDDERYTDITDWLLKNFGSCSFKRRRVPRWCWRPDYLDVGNFSQAWVGTNFFFRKEKDYTAFLLKWDR